MNEEQPGPPPSGQPVDQDTRNMLLIMHLLPLAGFVVAIPGASIIAPLIFWLMKKPESPLIDEHGKEVINFQINVLAAILLCVPLILLFVGILLIPLIALASLVFVILGAIDASNGKLRQYPCVVRLIK